MVRFYALSQFRIDMATRTELEVTDTTITRNIIRRIKSIITGTGEIMMELMQMELHQTGDIPPSMYLS